MPVSLEQSYAECTRIARERAKNFYYSFLALPKPKREAMCALYAFMRVCDDLSDEAGATREALDDWRAQLDQALEGEPPAHPIWPALADTVRRFNIPRPYLYDMMDGVTSDIAFTQPETFEDLYRYCYRVAGVVGLSITHVFGFSHASALRMAEQCGIAFQITNILRDVAEDARNGRTYIPGELMRKHGVTLEHMTGSSAPEALRALLKELGARAEGYYQSSRPLIGMVQQDSQAALWALIEIYTRLFARIEGSGYEVLERRHRVPTAEKLWILGRAMLR
jgi:15-cis-phytoene synthase